MPVFGGENEESDRRAVKMMEELCPDRQVIPISARAILSGGGNIHCITQQVPEGIPMGEKNRREEFEKDNSGSHSDELRYERRKNLEKAEQMIRQAAEQGAQVILLPELFERPYFCQEKRYDYYDYALPVEENPAVAMGKRLAEELDVVLPISFYERDGNVLYNSIACIDGEESFWGFTGRPTSPVTIFTRKNSILPREIRASGCSGPGTAPSASESAGTSGSRRLPGLWRLRERN